MCVGRGAQVGSVNKRMSAWPLVGGLCTGGHSAARSAGTLSKHAHAAWRGKSTAALATRPRLKTAARGRAAEKC